MMKASNINVMLDDKSQFNHILPFITKCYAYKEHKRVQDT